MTILLIVVALVVITAVSVFAVGDTGRLRADDPDREPADLPDDRPLAAPDIDRVRFALGVRGYRMDQVDDLLDRVSAELVRRDDYEAALVEQVRGLGAEPVPAPSVLAPGSGSVDPDGDDGARVAANEDSADAGEHG